jgi:hypothetical protein
MVKRTCMTFVAAGLVLMSGCKKSQQGSDDPAADDPAAGGQVVTFFVKDMSQRQNIT